MNYFERDYESSQVRTKELLLNIANKLRKQNSMIKELFAKVGFLTKLSEKYENNNRENADELIESFTNCDKEIDTLKEICDYIKAELSCEEDNDEILNSKVEPQEIDTLKEICDYVKAEMDYVEDNDEILNSTSENQEIRLNKLEDHSEMH